MTAIGLIYVTEETVQPSITVEGEASPLIFVEDASDNTNIEVQEDASGIGNITVVADNDDLLVTVVVDDAIGLVTVNEPDEYVQIDVLDVAVQVTSVSLEDIQDMLDLYELHLGAPSGNEYILSSQVNEVRSWIKPSGKHFGVVNKTGAQVVSFDVDYVITGAIYASADGNLCTAKVGWGVGDSDILRRKDSATTDRRSVSLYHVPKDDTKNFLYFTLTGNATVFITAERFR